jgi:hypothetical protein
MKLTAEELQERLKSGENYFNLFETEDISPKTEIEKEEEENENQVEVVAHRFNGRTPGAKNTPDILFPIIGAAARISGTVETAKAFGISPNSVSAIKNYGRKSYETPVVPGMKDKINELSEQAQEKAIDRMVRAISCITDSKLENAKISDLSSVAANMARVVEKTTPKTGENTGLRIVILAPSMRTSDSYEVLDA